jgi:iron complex outermembrane recepter protein
MYGGVSVYRGNMVGDCTPGIRWLVLTAVAILALGGGEAFAQAAKVHVPAQPLAQSLKDVAHQTGANILFAPDAVRNLRAVAVEGSMSAQDAVSRLIAGTNLQIVLDSSGGLIVRPVNAAHAPPEAPPPAAAQESPVVETIIVTGIRGALQRDLDVKRNALGLVDAITMEDTGKFPDSNLATALMRIPGVTVNRGVTSMNGINSATGDPTEITVRGFGPTFNETLFDGRKISSGVSNRGFDFSALNSDFVQEVDILKSPAPWLSAGAIGATINIKYPKPLDNPGLRLAASASTTYVPEEGQFTPNGNVLFSDTFANDRIGILLAGAYAETKSRSNEVSVWGWEGTYLDPCQFAGAIMPCASALVPGTNRPVWFPQAYGVYQIHNWQMRENALAVVQWQPTNALLVTLNGNFSRGDLKERQHNYAMWNNPNEMRNVTTAADGTITSFVRYNTPTDFDAQINEQVLQSYDVGLNVKWNVNSKLTITADVDMALSSLNPGGQFGDFSVDVGYGPSTGAGIYGNNTGVAVSAGGGHVLPYYTSYGPNGDVSQFLNPNIIGSHVVVLMSQRNRNVVNQAKLEGSWEQDHLRVAAGLQYEANHMKLANYHDFANNQWQAYAGYGPASNNHYTSGANAGLPAGVALPSSMFTKSFSTENFIPGWSGSSALPPRILAFDALSVFRYLEGLGSPTTPTKIPGFNWGCCNPAYDGAFQVVFDPSSFQHIYEDNYAGYFLVTGDTTIRGMPLKFHAGVRSEYTDLTSTGVGRLPTALTIMPSDHTAFLVAYGTAGQVSNKHSYRYLLPNLDLNLVAAEDLQIRFDASRTLTRPPLSYITPVLNLTASERVGSLVATGGNPGLMPYVSDNIDLSAEWYYAPNSYVSVDTFLKNVSNFIVSGTTTQTINGVIDPTTGQPALFRVSSYVNGPTANVYGLELAMQHVFGDTGFGFQANGTVVQSDRPYNAHDLTTSGFAVTGLADSANVIAFYDKNGFQMRIAANWRDSYLDRFGQQQNYSAFGAEPTFVNSSWNVDLSTSYEITEQLAAYCEVMNLLDSTYSTRGRFSEQVLDVVAYGRRITLGVHYKL